MSTGELIRKESKQAAGVMSSIIPEKQAEAVAKLSQVVSMIRGALSESTDQLEKALITANGTLMVKENLAPLLPMLRALEGSHMGFQTDRDKDVANGAKPYPDSVLLECCTVALLKGAQLVGKQFMIISANVYLCQAGTEAAVLSFPGLNNWDAELDTVKSMNGVAQVRAIAKWTLDGEKCSALYDGTNRPFIHVRVNSGMGDEAVIGKAKRKLYAKVLEKLTGGAVMTADDDGGIDDQASESELPRIEEKEPISNAAVSDFFRPEDLAACTEILQVNKCQREMSKAMADAGLSTANIKQINDVVVPLFDGRRNEIRSGRGGQ